MPQSNLKNARHVAERIRKRISSTRLDNIKTTVSIGIAEFGRQHDTPEKLIADGERTLYSAKENGKNRIISGIQI